MLSRFRYLKRSQALELISTYTDIEASDKHKKGSANIQAKVTRTVMDGCSRKFWATCCTFFWTAPLLRRLIRQFTNNKAP